LVCCFNGILAVYVVLDGYDFGAELFIYFTKTEKDKKAITNAIGLWDANEVWLIAAGVLFFCFSYIICLVF
jgi:cytochrome d ubiquinol oxidase subunit II